MMLAQVTDAAGHVSNATTGPTLSATAPYLAFSETLIHSTLASPVVSGTKTPASVQLQITNHGNVASTGTTTVAIYASTTPTASGGTLIRTESVKLPIGTGKSTTLNVALQSIPAITNGSYYLVAKLTDPDGNVTSAASGSTYTIAAPYISLAESVTVSGLPATLTSGESTHAFALVDITNHGNIATTGTSQLSLSFVPAGDLTASVPIKTESLALRIKPGSGTNVRVPLATIPTLTSGVDYLVLAQVTDPQGHVTEGATSQSVPAGGGGTQTGMVTLSFSGKVGAVSDDSKLGYVPAGIKTGAPFTGTVSFNSAATARSTDATDAYYSGTDLDMTVSITIDGKYKYVLSTPSSSDEIDLIGSSFELFKRGPSVNTLFSPNPPFSHLDFGVKTDTDRLAAITAHDISLGSTPSAGVSDQQTTGAAYYYVNATLTSVVVTV
jgi:hypothetical protein